MTRRQLVTVQWNPFHLPHKFFNLLPDTITDTAPKNYIPCSSIISINQDQVHICLEPFLFPIFTLNNIPIIYCAFVVSSFILFKRNNFIIDYIKDKDGKK